MNNLDTWNVAFVHVNGHEIVQKLFEFCDIGRSVSVSFKIIVGCSEIRSSSFPIGRYAFTCKEHEQKTQNCPHHRACHCDIRTQQLNKCCSTANGNRKNHVWKIRLTFISHLCCYFRSKL